MPTYFFYPPNSPNPLLLPGVNGFLQGYLNVNQPMARMAVTSVAVASNVVTIGVKMLEGNHPTTGALITVAGTSTDSGVANVNGQPLLSATFNLATGTGTVSYAATGSNQATTADNGMAYVPVQEVGEGLVAKTTIAFAIPSVGGHNDNGLTLTWSTSYPVAPSGVTVQLQAAMFDQDSQYAVLDTSTNVNGEIRAITLTRYRFVRAKISGVSGTNPTVVIKIGI